MACNCEAEVFTCGASAEIKIGSTLEETVSHIKNKKTSFVLGDTEIIVNSEVRTFRIAHDGNWSYTPTFLLSQGLDSASCGGTATDSQNHSVSEAYECINTVLYFLDMRYNNAIGKETTETLSFSEASSATAGFKETWGTFYYPKFVIENHNLTTKVDYFIVLNGVKTVLKTTTATRVMNSSDNPLILVWPNPPSKAIPSVNCEDIIQYGFYDYHAVGDEEGQIKIKRDGGDDFYFTDWMRNVGVVSQVKDQSDAEMRYYEYYLGGGYLPSQPYFNPGIYIDSTPVGSIAQDASGNIFYSIEFDGEVFNSLTNGDLPTLFPNLGSNQKFFPVGLV